jgi:hypothetical protein
MQKIYVVKFSHFLGLCKLTAPNHPLFPWSLIENYGYFFKNEKKSLKKFVSN